MRPDCDAAAGFGQELATWIVQQGLGGSSVADLLEGFSVRVAGAGVLLSRTYLAIPTISREIRAVNVTWRPGGPALREGVAHERFAGAFEQSPVAFMLRENIERRRWRLSEPGGTEGFSLLEELRRDGDTDYIAHLVPFGVADSTALRGVALTACTDRPGGFLRHEVELLTRLVPPLALAAYRMALFEITSDVLGAYIGRDAASHVLNGEVRRGHGQRRTGALMFADLRGFTGLSEREGEGLVARLGEHLAAMAEPVEEAGGEVLKFLGDGLLAAFAADEDDTPAAACSAALCAALNALGRNAGVNAARAGEDPLDLDVALHLGDVFYGNIGAGTRLDFTVIGPAVNECSRIETLCGRLGRALLMSAPFAAACGSATESLGFHQLRGVSEPREIFALREGG